MKKWSEGREGGREGEREGCEGKERKGREWKDTGKKRGRNTIENKENGDKICSIFMKGKNIM